MERRNFLKYLGFTTAAAVAAATPLATIEKIEEAGPTIPAGPTTTSSSASSTTSTTVPGVGGRSFKTTFEKDWFKTHDVLQINGQNWYVSGKTDDTVALSQMDPPYEGIFLSFEELQRREPRLVASSALE